MFGFGEGGMLTPFWVRVLAWKFVVGFSSGGLRAETTWMVQSFMCIGDVGGA